MATGHEWANVPCVQRADACVTAQQDFNAPIVENEKPSMYPMTIKSEHVIAGPRLTCLISNAHRLLKARYRKSPLWALVADLTGNGSTTSAEICRDAGYDPNQPCDTKHLKKP